MSNEPKEVKCIVWDLDETLWSGTLLENDNIVLKPGIMGVLKTMDNRGILQSIASRNEFELAYNKLKALRIADFFLYPEINWDAKSASMGRIQKNLNIALDTFVFVDDQPYERSEVQSVFPQVECFDATEYSNLSTLSRFNPRFITSDSRRRRKMYQDDIRRKREESDFTGPSEAFLASLDMHFTIAPATQEDLKRAEELTVRTNQLNATGETYSYDELNRFRNSENHRLLICELTDKYGSYGKIGLALLEITDTRWYLKLLLMSCRVMSRGVGTVLLSHIMQSAKKDGKKLLADFRETDRNRMMYVTYRFANFRELERDDQNRVLLENDLSIIQPFPAYLKLTIAE